MAKGQKKEWRHRETGLRVAMTDEERAGIIGGDDFELLSEFTDRDLGRVKAKAKKGAKPSDPPPPPVVDPPAGE